MNAVSITAKVPNREKILRCSKRKAKRVSESAGINRLGIVNERVIQRTHSQ